MFESSFLGVPGWLNRLSVWLLVSAQVMISWFMGLSPSSGSVITAWSLLGILSFSLSLSLCPSPAYALSLSLSLKKNTFFKVKKNKSSFLNHLLQFYRKYFYNVMSCWGFILDRLYHTTFWTSFYCLEMSSAFMVSIIGFAISSDMVDHSSPSPLALSQPLHNLSLGLRPQFFECDFQLLLWDAGLSFLWVIP